MDTKEETFEEQPPNSDPISQLQSYFETVAWTCSGVLPMYFSYFFVSLI